MEPQTNNTDHTSSYLTGDINSRKFFVGGLRLETTEDDLRRYFESFGHVEAVRVTMNMMTQTSRGFGFVTMQSEAAKKEIFTMKDRHAVGGKLVTLRAMQDNASAETQRRIFVGGLPPTITEGTLVEYFSKYGKVESTSIATDDNGKHRGFGFVSWATEASCLKALQSQSIHWVTPTVKVEIRKAEAKRPIPSHATAMMGNPNMFGTFGGMARFGSAPVPFGGSPVNMAPQQPSGCQCSVMAKILSEGLKWNWRPGGSNYPAFEIDPLHYTVVADQQQKMFLQPTQAEYERIFQDPAIARTRPPTLPFTPISQVNTARSAYNGYAAENVNHTGLPNCACAQCTSYRLTAQTSFRTLSGSVVRSTPY